MQLKAWRGMNRKKALLLSILVFIAASLFILNGAKERAKDLLAEAGEERKDVPALRRAKNEGEFLQNGSGRLSNPFITEPHIARGGEKVKNEENHLEDAALGKRQDLVLTGVMECGGERAAIIESGGKSGLYREKERLGAYEIESVALERVVLLRGKERVALEVARW